MNIIDFFQFCVKIMIFGTKIQFFVQLSKFFNFFDILNSKSSVKLALKNHFFFKFFLKLNFGTKNEGLIDPSFFWYLAFLPINRNFVESAEFLCLLFFLSILCSIFSLFPFAEAKAVIEGPAEKYIKKGSSLKLVCRFENVTQHPQTVFW